MAAGGRGGAAGEPAVADRARGRRAARRRQPRAPLPRHAHGRNARRPALLVVRDIAAGGRRLCRAARPRGASGRAGAEPAALARRPAPGRPCSSSTRRRSGRRISQALRTFVRGGGRLVAAGLSPAAMRELASRVPVRAPGSGSVREDGLEIDTGGGTVWRDEGLVAVRRVGDGTVELLADSSPLQNRLLGAADNAALRSRARRRRATGRSSSSRATTATERDEPALGPAARLEAAARGPRPRGARRTWSRAAGASARPRRRAGASRRRAASTSTRSPAVVARSKRRDAAVGPVRREARDALLRRAVAPAGRGRRRRSAPPPRLGLADEDAEALLRPARTDADVLALGRAAARIRQDHR